MSPSDTESGTDGADAREGKELDLTEEERAELEEELDEAALDAISEVLEE